MVGLISSEKVVLGVVVGIPLVVMAAMIAGMYPKLTRPVVGAASVVAVVLIAIVLWAAFRPGGTTIAAGARGATLPSDTVGGPVGPATPQPTTAPPATTPAGPPCSPSGTTLQIAAQAIAFDKDCLAAPANTAFTVAFDNRDVGVPHNVQIFSDPAATKRLGGATDAGDVITGPKEVTYQVSALPEGTYFFRCDVHPAQMNGTFVVA